MEEGGSEPVAVGRRGPLAGSEPGSPGPAAFAATTVGGAREAPRPCPSSMDSGGVPPMEPSRTGGVSAKAPCGRRRRSAEREGAEGTGGPKADGGRRYASQNGAATAGAASAEPWVTSAEGATGGDCHAGWKPSSREEGEESPGEKATPTAETDGARGAKAEGERRYDSQKGRDRGPARGGAAVAVPRGARGESLGEGEGASRGSPDATMADVEMPPPAAMAAGGKAPAVVENDRGREPAMDRGTSLDDRRRGWRARGRA